MVSPLVTCLDVADCVRPSATAASLRETILWTRLKWTCPANNIRPVKELDSYLNDHLAGSVSALELIGDWPDVHKGEPFGDFFAETEAEIKADQHILRDVMRRLGLKESSVRICFRNGNNRDKSW